MRRAFTLIELLAVVVIIGVLLSVFLPGLAGAWSSARSSRCITNIHGLLQTEATDAADHRGRHGFVVYGWTVDDAHCPADPGTGTFSYGLFTLDQPLANTPAPQTEAELDTYEPSRLMMATDGSWFRHGLRPGERMESDENSAQWRRTYRNKGYLDGSVRPMRGPLS